MARRFACKANKHRYKTMQNLKQKPVTAGIANLNSGAIYVGSTATPASGATIAHVANQ